MLGMQGDRSKKVALVVLPFFAIVILTCQSFSFSANARGRVDSPTNRRMVQQSAASRQSISSAAVEVVPKTMSAPSPSQSGLGWGKFAGASIGLVLAASTFIRSRSSSIARGYWGGYSYGNAGGFSGNWGSTPKYSGVRTPYPDKWLTFADNGFDPLGIAVQPSLNFGDAATTYYNYRESEVKHGRFAMAAFMAIFGEENDTKALFNQLGVPGYTENVAGSLQLDEYQLQVLAFGLAIQLAAELTLQYSETDGRFSSVQYNASRMPGDLKFDPLNFKGLAGGNLLTLHNSEIQFGRLAMLGITIFLYREFVSP